MMLLDKKRQELFYFELFRSVFKEAPQGIACIQERPDFVVRDRATPIGIEVTRYFRPTPDRHRPMQEQFALQRQIVQRAQREFERCDARKLQVQVVFRTAIDINMPQVSVAASGLAIVLAATPLNQTLARLVNVPKRPSWPTGVTSVHARLCIENEPSYWQPATAAWVRRLTAADIQDVISRKEASARQYDDDLRGTWLLIVADRLSFVELTDDSKIAVYESSFDRVLFLDVFTRSCCPFNMKQGSLDAATSWTSLNTR